MSRAEMQFNHQRGEFHAHVNTLIVAGWTGRDAAAVAHHVAELQDIGVAPPSTTPLFYRVSATLLTQARNIQVLGGATSGEAEPFVIRHGGALWLGLGSDHTDRAMEASSVAASKQACPKVCAAHLWRFDEVTDHLDDLMLKSWIRDGAKDWQPYQDGSLAGILPLPDLLARTPLADGDAMLCGTLPALCAIRSALHFRSEITDPVLGRTITLEYETTVLPTIT